MKGIVIGIFVGVILVAGHSVKAQSEQEKILELEARKVAMKQRLITQKLDSAIEMSDQGQYEDADREFRYVLNHMSSIPSDFTFHFGKNSFFLGKFKQSIDWLNKYLQLKGTTGQYSEQAAEWLTKAEEELLKERETQSQVAGVVLSRDYNIDCGPSGKVVCPVCDGTTVVIKKNYFKDTYTTCKYCNKMGFLSCEDYNKLIRGQLTPVDN